MTPSAHAPGRRGDMRRGMSCAARKMGIHTVGSMAMVWYRCSCGYIIEIEPHVGEVVSVYHLHAQTSAEKSALVRMEPLLDSVPEPTLAAAGPRSK